MNTPRLHSTDALKYTTQGDHACSWCNYLIPEKRTSRNTTELQDWSSAEVAGMFCSEAHARAATNNASYRSLFAYEVLA
jgi:hypothetical protein